MTPKHRLNKTIGSLQRIGTHLGEGLTPRHAIQAEVDRVTAAESMTRIESEDFRLLLTACLVMKSMNDARKRREPIGSNDDPPEDPIIWTDVRER